LHRHALANGVRSTRRPGFAQTGWDLGVLAEIQAAAVAPQTVASGLPDGIVAVAISEPTDWLETCVVWRSDDTSPTVAAFVDVARGMTLTGPV
jgi:hypothetical protein